MTGIYIFGGIILVAIGILVYYKIKWARASGAESRSRTDNIEKERLEHEKLANHKI